MGLKEPLCFSEPIRLDTPQPLVESTTITTTTVEEFIAAATIIPSTPSPVTGSRPATRPASRAPPRPPSRGRSPHPNTLGKTATIQRARAMSNQPGPMFPQPTQPSTPTPAEPQLGKHVRESSESVASSTASPKKRRRLDDDVEMDVNADADADGDGDVVVETDKGKQKEKDKPAEEQAEEGDVVAPLPRSSNVNGRTAAVRGSSQPPRSRGGLREISAEPPTSRRTRAGSAGASAGRTARRSAGRATVNGGLPPVMEVEPGRFSIGGFAVPRPAATNGQQPLAVESSLIASSSQAPATAQPEPQPFITYPLPGEPVQELKALTHFDSGNEFFGTESKQGYKTDWHDGVVFDDPFDSATIARARAVAAEDGLDGHMGVGAVGVGIGGDEDADGVEIYGDVEVPDAHAPLFGPY